MEPKVRIEKFGRHQSAIDQLGLGEKVLALRRNLSLEEVTDRINKLKPPEAPNIGISQVHYYCQKHGVAGDNRISRNRVSKMQAFNSLDDAIEVRDRIIRHSKKLEHIVDQIKEDEEKLSEIAGISGAYLNACKCLLEVNKNISRIEKEHLGHEKVRKVLKTLLEILDEFPDVKTRFMEKLRESTVYETIKYV